MLVLDTDALSLIQFGREPAAERLRARIQASDDEDCVTIVTFEEQMRGWLNYIAKANSPVQQVAAYARLSSMLDDYRGRRVLDFDDQAAVIFQRLRASKVRIGTGDLRIAAIALARQATLITRNLSDFRKVPGLPAQDWSVA
jgi:tRNA(fMet)-specific endonuclease VapC